MQGFFERLIDDVHNLKIEHSACIYAGDLRSPSKTPEPCRTGSLFMAPLSESKKKGRRKVEALKFGSLKERPKKRSSTKESKGRLPGIFERLISDALNLSLHLCRGSFGSTKDAPDPAHLDAPRRMAGRRENRPQNTAKRMPNCKTYPHQAFNAP